MFIFTIIEGETMRKKILIFFIIFLASIFISFKCTVFATNTLNTINNSSLSDTRTDLIEYKDSVADIVNVPKDTGKINLYFFYGDGCIVCEDSVIMIEDLKQTYYNYLNIYTYEVWHNNDNNKLLEDSATQFGYTKSNGVPIILINDTMFVGYADFQKPQIEEIINGFIDNFNNINNKNLTKNNYYTLPILGKVDVKNSSIPLIAVVLGFIDGFNPCAMWVLILLISLFLGMKDRKKALILGTTFLFISGLVYFLSMFGINFVLDIFNYGWLKTIVAIFILVAGILNFKKYLKTRNEDAGCTVVNDKKRKTVISKSHKIINEENIIISLIGIIVLAVSVNSLELLCSLGFPVVFAEILSLNGITGIARILYILLYVLFYMLDDIIVFTISMITLKATGITNKYTKLCNLISSIIMITIAILLIIKPAWLMLNF